MPFEKINNLNVYYEIHGEGEPILLMHHGFGCSKIWKYIIPGFTDKGYKVIAYDRRGFGRSEGGRNFFDFYESGRYRAESVEELRLLKERLGIGSCHMVGQCEGGVIGIDYAVKYAPEVRTLTIAGTQCFSEGPVAQWNSMHLVNKFVDLEPRLQVKMIEWHGKEAETRYDHFARYGGAYGIDHFDLRPILPMVACPALVLYPDRSSNFGVEQSIAFYRHLPKGELAVFPKCGHNTYEQRPEDYIRTVLDFLKRHGNRDTDTAQQPAVSCLA